jgi:hypothetical protein
MSQFVQRENSNAAMVNVLKKNFSVMASLIAKMNLMRTLVVSTIRKFVKQD